MKIVVDTNVIVSALLRPQSLPAKILDLVLDGTIGIVYDNNILAEYIDVLNREKFREINKDLIKIVLYYITHNGQYIIAEPQNTKFDDEDDKAFMMYIKVAIQIILSQAIKNIFPKKTGAMHVL